MEKVENRFMRYIRINTQSNSKSNTTPSTEGQRTLGALLVEELIQLGLKDVEQDVNGYVTATLPGNSEQGPCIGLIAHMDTSPDFRGSPVTPRIVHKYNGDDIVLSNGIVMDTHNFPELLNYLNQDLIVTDGHSLLGADDKAGIAEIMAALEYWIKHPEIPRCTARICFTPDEEIGQGADHFDVENFNADFAYTLDGGPLGELEYENFNAASAEIKIQGVNIHPGTAKNKMKNALLISSELISMLPLHETPEHTEGYEGFFHVTELNGNVEQAHMHIIIRDHDFSVFELRKSNLKRIVTYLNSKHSQGTITLEMKESYLNMKEKILPVYHIVETPRKAMEALGIKPIIKPIRGGTDGARLSYMGLPTPNIFTGGHNFHGKYEYIPIESMEKAVMLIVKIFELYTKDQPIDH